MSTQPNRSRSSQPPPIQHATNVCTRHEAPTMKNGKRLTTLAMVLVLLGGLAGCGSSGTSFAAAEHAWETCTEKERAANVRGAHPTSAETLICHSLAVRACQAEIATASDKQPHGVVCEVAEPCHGSDCYLGPKSKTEESTTPTQEHTPEESEHTPEENARHRRSLESQKQAHEEVERSLEKDKPQIEQAHREADKACYETGRTEAECNGPEHQRQEERANAENRQRQIESGELQVHE